MRLRRRGSNEARTIQEGMVFGRLPSCEWPLNDASVSRRHARVLRELGSWFLEDLGSSNGTMLNGVRVPRLELRGGDLITLGSVAFDVLADDDELPARPAAQADVVPMAAATAAAATAATRESAGSAQDANRERARLHAGLRRSDRSRGFGDLSQQSPGMKLLAVLIGLAVLAGVAIGVRAIAGIL
ncbi:MAG: FHA domain-containing protein [Planctomycetota bacterium]|nr:FHA domain-containing protein [Planctomycetota bacterium]